MGIMDPFRPRWRHSDSRVRLEAARALTDQPVLAWLARWDADRDVRMAALEKLKDHASMQGLYAELARIDESPDIRIAAAVRLDDQGVFEALVPELAQVVQTRGGPREVRQWLGRVTDQRVLARIAEKCPVPSIRAAAISRVTAPEIVNEVVLRLAPEERVVAIARATDQAVLQTILEERRGKGSLLGARSVTPDEREAELRLAQLRAADAAKCSDTSELEARATTDPARLVRMAAIERIVDQRVLARIAESCSWEDVAEAAVQRVAAQSALAAIAKGAAASSARSAALARLTDEPALADIAERDENRTTGLAAVARLRATDLLARVAARATLPETRAAAIQRLPTEELVLSVVQGARSFVERVAIGTRLVALGWTPRRVHEEGCRACNGTGVVWVNTDSAFERDVASYECRCDGKRYSLTVHCEKVGRPSFEITCGIADREDARKLGGTLPTWIL